MLRFLGKSAASMARNGGSSPSEEVDEGLSTWEVVNATHSDDEDLYSYDSDDVISDGDGVIGGEAEPNPVEEEEDDASDVVSMQSLSVSPPMSFPVEMARNCDVVVSMQSLSVSPPMSFPVEMARNYVQRDYAEEYYDYNDDDVHDDDDDGDVHDYDVDDELVPWKLKDRFGKQRIKKIGKRSGPKLKNKSKKLPYYDNRPGFSYGKFRGCC